MYVVTKGVRALNDLVVARLLELGYQWAVNVPSREDLDAAVVFTFGKPGSEQLLRFGRRMDNVAEWGKEVSIPELMTNQELAFGTVLEIAGFKVLCLKEKQEIRFGCTTLTTETLNQIRKAMGW